MKTPVKKKTVKKPAKKVVESRSTKRKPHIYTTKAQRLKLAKRICDTYAEANHTIASVCESHGVGERTFYEWCNADSKYYVSEIAELYKGAKDKFHVQKVEKLKELAVSSLQKRIEGFQYEEESIEYINDNNGKPMIKGKKITKKTVLPDVTASIFVSKNVLPEQFSDKQQIQLSGGVETTVKPSDQELDDRIKYLESLLAKTKAKDK